MTEPTDEGVLLGVRSVVRRFGSTVALDGVDLSIRSGESMALLGANGAGKSSLVKILSGAAQPDAGHVLVDGERRVLRGVPDARRHGICFVPQELTVAPELTVAENVLVSQWPSRAGFVRNGAGHELTVEVCRRVGLEVPPERRVGDLSPAEQRLLMIARGLLDTPRVLILDEPTAALGAAEAGRMVEVLTDLRAQGLTLVYISHRMEEIAGLCDAVTVLRNGKVVMRDVASAESVKRAVEVGMAAGDVDGPARSSGRRAATGPPALAADGLVTPVLRGVSVRVGQGEIVGVAGLLGAGRSELLRALAGADPVDEGVITVEGVELRARSPRHAIAAGVALLPEDRRNQGALLGLSVKDNLTMTRPPARGGWLRLRAERRIALDAIDRYGITCSGPDALLSTLSGGNQQKVILARWLMVGARTLLLDEPTAGIDVVAKAELMRLVREAVDAGGAAIVVSSELDEISGYCDRIYVLRDGRVVAEVDGNAPVEELARLCGEPAVV
jgi:ABC-type sugar transport system ATPase subunit